MSCDTKGILTGVKGNNVFLPDVSCSDPSLRLLGYAGLIVGLVIHLPLYLMLTLKEVEVNPLTSVAFASGSFLAVARIEFLRVLALVRPAAGAAWVSRCHVSAVGSDEWSTMH